MKVLSILEPWATLIMKNKKVIETRSWKTNYRGPIYIHASQGKINSKDEHVQELLALIPEIQMNYGYIVCKANLVDCKYMDEKFIKYIKSDNQEYICGEYKLGRYAWILEDVEELVEPIKAKGHLGIWNLT